jgi:hypothetical protein
MIFQPLSTITLPSTKDFVNKQEGQSHGFSPPKPVRALSNLLVVFTTFDCFVNGGNSMLPSIKCRSHERTREATQINCL